MPFLLAALLCLAGTAQAEAKPLAPPQVGVRFSTCPGQSFPWSAALATLRTELAQEGVRRVELVSEAADPSRVWIEIASECGGPLRRIVVKVHDPRTRDVSRTTDLSDLPQPLRPRGIALAAAELARTVWTRPDLATSAEAASPWPSTTAGSTTASGAPSETREPAATSVPIPEATERSSKVQEATERHSKAQETTERSSIAQTDADDADHHQDEPTYAAPKIELTVAFSPRAFLADPTVTVGGHARLGVGRLHGGIRAATGSRGDPLGSVSLTLATIEVAADALLHATSSWTFRVGPRVSTGIARVAVTSTSANATANAPQQEPYFDIALEAGATAGLSKSWSLLFGVEAGIAWGLAARADNRLLGALDGWLLGAHVGVAYDFLQ